MNESKKLMNIVFSWDFIPEEKRPRPTEEELNMFYKRCLDKEGEETIKNILDCNGNFKKFNSKIGKRIEASILNLRTMEMALIFDDYGNLVKEISKKIEGAPKGTSQKLKVKVLTTYFLVFSNVWYFLEDYASTKWKTACPIFENVKENDKMYCRPEELYCIYYAYVRQNHKIYYSDMINQFNSINSSLQGRICQLFGIKFDGKKFEDIEDTIPVKFGEIRKIKKLIFPNFCGIQYDIFCVSNYIQNKDLRLFLQCYKKLKLDGYSKLEEEEYKLDVLEGEIQRQSIIKGKKVFGPYAVFSQEEANNFVSCFDNLQNKRLSLFIIDNEGKIVKKYSAKTFIGAVKYAIDNNLIDKDSNIEDDFKIINRVIYISKKYRQTKEVREYQYGTMDINISNLSIETDAFIRWVQKNYGKKLNYKKLSTQKVESFLKLDQNRLKAIRVYILTGEMDYSKINLGVVPEFLLVSLI